MRPKILTAAVGLTLGIALAAAPADAQGKSKSKAKDRGEGARPRVEQTRDRVYDAPIYGDRARTDDYGHGGAARGNGAGKVPPGWCKGVGNPHNTPENCGYSSSRRYEDREGRYQRGSGSYEMEHQEFHRYLDRKYRDLASRRPTDIQYQLELRIGKQGEHDRWHEEVGVRH